MCRKMLGILGVAALVAGGLSAQEPVGFDDEIRVDLVLVDVVVEDRSGAVLDLERQDFRLFHDGTPVEIRQFSRPAGAAAGAWEDSSTPDGLGQKVVVFVDNLHLQPSSRHRVFAALGDALESELAADAEVMVVAHSGTSEVVLEMTSNRRAWRRALSEQARGGAVSLMASNDRNSVFETIGDLAQRYQIAPGGAVDSHCREVGFVARAHAQQVKGRVLGAIGELGRFVNSLAGFDGPKMLLHVSDGIPLIAGTEAYRFAAELCNGTGANKGLESSTDVTATDLIRYNNWDPTQVSNELREFDTSRQWTELASQANAYQVSFYPFQAHQKTLRSSSATTSVVRSSFDVEREGERNRQDSLMLLARATGGVATLGSNDVTPALTKMRDDAQYSYQLAFESPTPGDRRRHAIRVDVERPGVKLRYRSSYISKSAEDGVSDRLLSALWHGFSRNPLDVGLEVVEARAQRSDAPNNVDVRVKVPFERLILLDEAEGRRALFTVFVVARDGRGRTTPVGRKTIPVQVPPDGLEEHFVYSVAVPVRAGDGSIGVAVHDEFGRQASFVTERVSVPGT